jgi:hypothetical protein
MAVIVLMVLLAAALTGLGLGRRRAALATLAAIPACALALGPEAGALAALTTAGLAAGAHLHRVVAEDVGSARRAL